MRTIFLLSAAVGIVVLSGCSGENRVIAEPSKSVALSSPAVTAAGSVPDLGGAWNWRATGRLTVPESVIAPIFAIPPEGPVTVVQCESSGTMDLLQTGATFTGVANRSSVTCETTGGLVFIPPTAAFPQVLPVADGSINGRAVHFLIGSVAGRGCPHNGAIMDLNGNSAATIRASGRCIVPGHPQSPAPLEPPPLGTSHDTSFVATRQ